MSHLVKQTSTTVIRELDLLERAVNRLGGTLNREATEAIYYAGQKVACDAAISFPGAAQQIAVHFDPVTGTYNLECDLYDGVLRQAVSTNRTDYYNTLNEDGTHKVGCDNLFMHYKAEELDRVALSQGRTIGRSVTPRGVLVLNYVG